MNAASRRSRLLALLAVRDRQSADELLSQSRPGSEGLAAELNRPGVEREVFLGSKPEQLPPSVARVLNALDDTDEGMERAAALVEVLRWISNIFPKPRKGADIRSAPPNDMETTDPGKAIASSDVPDAAKSHAINHLASARKYLEESEANRLDTLIDELRGSGVHHLWARGLDARLIGSRGEVPFIALWKRLLVRTVGALVPDSTANPYATVRELLALAGVETSRQYVRETLRPRRR